MTSRDTETKSPQEAEAVADTDSYSALERELKRQNELTIDANIQGEIANETASANKELDQATQSAEFAMQLGQYNRRGIGAAFQAAGMATKTIAALNQDQRSQKAFQVLAGTTAIISSLASVYSVMKDRSDIVSKSEDYENKIDQQKINSAEAEKRVLRKYGRLPAEETENGNAANSPNAPRGAQAPQAPAA